MWSAVCVLFNVLKPLLHFLWKASFGLLARKLGEYAVAHTHQSSSVGLSVGSDLLLPLLPTASDLYLFFSPSFVVIAFARL